MSLIHNLQAAPPEIRLRKELSQTHHLLSLTLFSEDRAEQQVQILPQTSAFRTHVDIFWSTRTHPPTSSSVQIFRHFRCECEDEPAVEVDQTAKLFDFLNILRRMDSPDFIVKAIMGLNPAS